MTGRIMLALLAVIPAAMAYPWQSTLDWWVFGIAVAVLIVVFAWWRGTFVTTLVARRAALLRRRDEPRHQVQHSDTDARTTAVLQVLSGDDDQQLLSTLAGYLDRYGIRCDAVRVTHRDTPAGRSTWVGLTLSAAANLGALQARSANIPLRETAQVTLRRLADHLRELGWSVSTVDANIPDLLGPAPKERWRSVQDGEHGYLTCYAVPAGDSLAETLDEVRTASSSEVWTVVELSGMPTRPDVAAVCAIRTDELPDAAPVPNLRPLRGQQRRTLATLHPESTARLALSI
ncbi:type VII secretion protein EccE [Mycolicibacterium mengxianglii]|uniref:type VII secretion protein EccE n=1 Tax=Mycolicibacterium mengxianglii TaxID=2736649 RepID=UPI0018EEF261|nr:type VII secretion protein EccE [Mycolicibacterium mengxianglii]